MPYFSCIKGDSQFDWRNYMFHHVPSLYHYNFVQIQSPFYIHSIDTPFESSSIRRAKNGQLKAMTRRQPTSLPLGATQATAEKSAETALMACPYIGCRMHHSLQTLQAEPIWLIVYPTLELRNIKLNKLKGAAGGSRVRGVQPAKRWKRKTKLDWFGL